MQCNESLADIKLWMMENKVCINTGKSKAMLSNSPRADSSNWRIRLNRNAIDFVDSMPYFGDKSVS